MFFQMTIILMKITGVFYMLNTCVRRNKNLLTDSSPFFLMLFSSRLNVPDRALLKKQRLDKILCLIQTIHPSAMTTEA